MSQPNDPKSPLLRYLWVGRGLAVFGLMCAALQIAAALYDTVHFDAYDDASALSFSFSLVAASVAYLYLSSARYRWLWAGLGVMLWGALGSVIFWYLQQGYSRPTIDLILSQYSWVSLLVMVVVGIWAALLVHDSNHVDPD